MKVGTTNVTVRLPAFAKATAGKKPDTTVGATVDLRLSTSTDSQSLIPIP